MAIEPRIARFLTRSVDIASLAAFRILFGALMLVSVIRFWAKGWIGDFYVTPSFHFHYFGFSWISPWPETWMYVHFAVLGLASALVMVGLFYRVAAAVLFLSFTYVELLEKATYLNHYYLISIVSLLMIFMPLHRAASLDALRDPRIASQTAPAWALHLLRFQIGAVYVFAGIAKLGPDWLLRGEPLGIWLAANADLPVVGPFLAERWVAHAASFAGAAFDLSVVFFLLRDGTRRYAYAAVIAFHTITGLLFPIGVFPWIMSASALVFFPPSWPRDALARISRRFGRVDVLSDAPAPARALGPLGRLGAALLAVHVIVQIALPLRHFVYPGNTAWSEEGFRFAWRVMLVEKLGFVEFRVKDRDTGRVMVIDPARYLTPLQTKMMAQSPDMVLELARHIAADLEARRGQRVAVFADAWVTMNGRPSRRIIDPTVNLAEERDSLLPRPWILPLEDESPAAAISSLR